MVTTLTFIKRRTVSPSRALCTTNCWYDNWAASLRNRPIKIHHMPLTGMPEKMAMAPNTTRPYPKNTPLREAIRVAERVRDCLTELCRAKGVTEGHLSIGVAAVVPEHGETYGVLIAAVDQALYRAKEAGRNRIESMQVRRDKQTLVAHSFPRPAA